ncbi:MAG: ABC transporter permease [Crocinitomicaceae bacterium]|nr:ABC transporter permease [Crocinitomicaceae bacterium]MDG1776944.1 ABC transporter permease [Crocinitomicaceae bacterium]
MRNSMLIAIRELKERIGSRSFLLFSTLGPLIVLGFVYLMFAFGGQSKQHWNVLVADPTGIMENKMMVNDDKSISYAFANDYIEMEEFADAKKYQLYDALLEVNEKVLSNKVGFVFFRESPSIRMQTRVQYQFERRLEELMVKEFTSLSLKDFRKIKQPLSVNFRDVYDPYNESSDLSGWVGMFYGGVIFTFIFLFGITIMRSVSREKSNRIVEVLLASVSPNQLMIGKIVGVGLSALLQFVVWVVVIGVGLYFMRETLFPDMLNAANMNIHDLTLQVDSQSYQDTAFASREYNQFVELVYNRVQFVNMTVFFMLFFISGYLFYGALFAAVGATMGSESDGQQFVIPLIVLLCLALYGGYYSLNYPESPMVDVLHYLPFTSPVVVMVKLAQGYYGPGHVYEIYLSLLALISSACLMLGLASRLYKNGILQFGHRVRLKHIFKWLKKS